MDSSEKKELQNDLQKALLSVMKRELRDQAVVKIQMDNGESLRVRPAELLYCQSEEHYVRFLWQDEKSGLYRVKLNAVEKALEGYHFLRVHKRYLVNREYIGTLQADRLNMMNGQEIGVLEMGAGWNLSTVFYGICIILVRPRLQRIYYALYFLAVQYGSGRGFHHRKQPIQTHLSYFFQNPDTALQHDRSV